MVNKDANNETAMTAPTPIPFIHSLKHIADGFSAILSGFLFITSVPLLVWMLLGGAANAPFVFLENTARIAFAAWAVYHGIAALIGYAVYVVFRAGTEWLDAALRSAITPESVSQEGEEPEPDAPNQRESAVAYLHDFIKRSKQATDDSAPLNPKSGA